MLKRVTYHKFSFDGQIIVRFCRQTVEKFFSLREADKHMVVHLVYSSACLVTN
jgi:hypothetical protein